MENLLIKIIFSAFNKHLFNEISFKHASDFIGDEIEIRQRLRWDERVSVLCKGGKSSTFTTQTANIGEGRQNI